MKRYDWKRFGKLLRLYRPDFWDAEDQQNPTGPRVSPYQLRPDGVFIVEPDPNEFPLWLNFSEVAALCPPDGDRNKPLLTLPATLPEIICFLEKSGEHCRLPIGMWQRLQKFRDLEPKHNDDRPAVAKTSNPTSTRLRGTRTGLEPTVANRSIGSGDMAKLFSEHITVKGGLASREQIERLLKDHRAHKELHAKAKLRNGQRAKSGQRPIAAEWDPVHFALALVRLGKSFESQMDELFRRELALADWRVAWNERKPNQPLKPTTLP